MGCLLGFFMWGLELWSGSEEYSSSSDDKVPDIDMLHADSPAMLGWLRLNLNQIIRVRPEDFILILSLCPVSSAFSVEQPRVDNQVACLAI